MTPVLLGALVLGAGGEDGATALVRLVPVESAPAGWLDLEESVFTYAAQRLGADTKPASIAADAWQAPGYKVDRARTKIRELLGRAREALARGEPKTARAALKDVEDLVAIGGVVAVLPASTLRELHAALVEATRGGAAAEAAAAARHARGLVGNDAGGDGGGDESRDQARDAGLTVEGEGTVLLDGVVIGAAPLRRYDLSPGVHYLRVVAPGRVARGERLELRSGAIERRDIYLDVAQNPLRRFESGLRADPIPPAVTASLVEVAVDAEAVRLLLLVPDGAAGAMTLRSFDVQQSTYGAAARLAADAGPAEVARAVDAALGLIALPGGEALTAAPGSGRGPVQKASAATAPGPAVEAAPSEPFYTSRWLWLGVGAVVVAGVVAGVVAATASSGPPGKAAVYLCPDGGGLPCAP